MKRNGFTLIELLAVIVVLAIIALIATPIILGIINDARKESQERSVELYASAVRNGIAAYQLREMKEVSAGTYTSETLPFDVEADGDVVCTTIDIYEDGGVYVADCTVNGVSVEYTYGEKQVIKGRLSSLCKPAEKQYFATSSLEPGYKYECDVDPNKEGYDHKFYVLNSTNENVNLIMDRNICEDGTEVTANKHCIYDWNSTANYVNGPITAMEKLTLATRDWKNLKQMTVNTFENYDNNIPIVNMSKSFITYARLPYYSEVDCYDESTGAFAFLYDHMEEVECLNENGDTVSCDQATYILGGIYVKGLSYISGETHYLVAALLNGNDIFTVRSEGEVAEGAHESGGIRPVISLDL